MTDTDVEPDRLLADVLGRIDSDDARLVDVLTRALTHLHAFVREAQPSEQEWLRAVDLLVRAGRASTPARNEMILLSDMLGLTSAVDDLNHAGPAGVTPSSVEGPFHSPAPARENGALIATGPEHARSRGRASTSGRPTTPAPTTSRTPRNRRGTCVPCSPPARTASTGSAACCPPATRYPPTARSASC